MGSTKFSDHALIQKKSSVFGLLPNNLLEKSKLEAKAKKHAARNLQYESTCSNKPKWYEGLCHKSDCFDYQLM